MSSSEQTDLTLGRYKIRVIEPGQVYGKHRPVLNGTDEPLVEFYQLPERSRDTPWLTGVFISRYRLSSLMEAAGSGPLMLLGSQSDHRLSGEEIHEIVAAVIKTTKVKMVRSHIGFFRRSYA